ncbi:MAG: YabP/YqfC family sporulation protein [Candidatus Borkfalkiaceae bacterium]|nr:YabP/YqfC family sporulation protein [Clostridia bacterium]MDY6223176.1 YabP/YqfC family sporulation protein [Christensenellaceae bacterium]
MQEINHSIQIDNRKNITVTGVESVKSFSPVKIELTLVSSKTLLIFSGNDFKIIGFSKESGTFRAGGVADGFRYGVSLRSKLFR